MTICAEQHDAHPRETRRPLSRSIAEIEQALPDVLLDIYNSSPFAAQRKAGPPEEASIVHLLRYSRAPCQSSARQSSRPSPY